MTLLRILAALWYLAIILCGVIVVIESMDESLNLIIMTAIACGGGAIGFGIINFIEIIIPDF